MKMTISSATRAGSSIVSVIRWRSIATYWRDDPHFDDTQRAAAAPAGLSGDGCGDASEAGEVRHPEQFWQEPNATGPAGLRHPRSHAPIAPPPQPLVPDLTGNHCLGLDVSGPAGGQWKLLLHNGRLTEVEDGLGPQCSAVFRLESPTFRALGDAGAGGRRGGANRPRCHRRGTDWIAPTWLDRHSPGPRPRSSSRRHDSHGDVRVPHPGRFRAGTVG